MKLVTKITAIFDRIIDLLVPLSGILLIFATLVVFINVSLRYLLNYSISWAVEVTSYSLLYLTFLLATWVLRGEGHVKIEIVLEHLKPRPQIVVNIITSILCVIPCLVFAWYAGQLTWNYFQEGRFYTTALRPPTWSLIIIISIGNFLLFIQLLRRAYQYLASWKALPTKNKGRRGEA